MKDMKDMEDKEVIKEGFNQFDRLINNTGFNYEEASDILFECYLSTHRTLQQCMIKLFIMLIRKLGKFSEKQPDRFDARNESAMNWIKQASKIEGYFPFI